MTANKLAATALRDRINFLETDAEKNRAESTRQMASLLEHIKQLESANQQVENRIATELQAKFEQELTALRQTLEERDAELQLRETSDRDAAARHASEIQALQNDIAATQQLLKENDRALGAATAENRRLQDRIAAVNAVHEQAMADAQRSFEARSQEYRQQITVLERRNESNTRRLREHGDELTRLQTQHMMLQRAADEQQHQTAAAQAEIVKLESQQQGLKTELAEARQRQQEQEDLSHELRRLGEQLAEKQGIIDSGVREFAALENQANQLRAQVAQLEEAKWLAGEEHGATLGRLNEQLDHLQTQLAAKEQNIAGREQECAALQQQLRQLREHLAHQEHRQNQREEEHGAAVAALQQELRQVGEQLIATRQSAEARGDEVNELHGRVRQLNDQIAALEHDRHQVADGHRSHIHSLEDQLWEVGKQLGEKQQQLEGREGEIYSLQDEVRALLQQISQLQQAREQAVNEHQAALGLVRDQL
ncbi:MAG: hypothetical protein FJ143_00810, partial [Deltaproteobacteria bacterium]|nr:hypothetical protein [Deltaproteobacteria bacterium]